jgi:hypothetical protein
MWWEADEPMMPLGGPNMEDMDDMLMLDIAAVLAELADEARLEAAAFAMLAAALLVTPIPPPPLPLG